MKTGDILALAGLGLAGVIGYKTLAARGVSVPSIEMPEIKMPDIAVLMPEIKIPDVFTIEGLSEMFPEMPDWANVGEWLSGQISGVKSYADEKLGGVKTYADEKYDDAKKLYDDGKTYVDEKFGEVKDLVKPYTDPIGYVSGKIKGITPTAGIEFPIKAKVLDPIIAPLAGMEAAPSQFWGIAQGLRSGAEKVIEEPWNYIKNIRPFAATLEAMR